MIYVSIIYDVTVIRIRMVDILHDTVLVESKGAF